MSSSVQLQRWAQSVVFIVSHSIVTVFNELCACCEWDFVCHIDNYKFLFRIYYKISARIERVSTQSVYAMHVMYVRLICCVALRIWFVYHRLRLNGCRHVCALRKLFTLIGNERTYRRRERCCCRRDVRVRDRHRLCVLQWMVVCDR